MKQFYTENNTKNISHICYSIQSLFQTHELFDRELIRPIFYYTLFDEKEHTLFKAIQNGHLEVVKYLVSMGADIHAKKDWAVRLASYCGRLEVVKYLVSMGADIHAENDFAVRWASQYGHLEVVKYLVSLGSDIRADNDYAVRLASCCGHLEVVKYLVSMGADIQHAYNDDEE